MTLRDGLGILGAMLIFGIGFHFGGLRAQAELADRETQIAQAHAVQAKQRALASEQRRALERDSAERIQRLTQAYETDKRHAQESANRTLADLRAGNLQLRQHWQAGLATDRLSKAAARAAESDAAEQRRAEGASDLIRLAAEWDAKERALQAVIRADRSE